MGLYLVPVPRKWWFRSKIANFPHHVYFVPPLKGFPWNWALAFGDKKTRMIGVPGRERNLISPAVWIQYTNVSDRQTDRQSDSKNHAYAQRHAVKTQVWVLPYSCTRNTQQSHYQHSLSTCRHQYQHSAGHPRWPSPQTGLPENGVSVTHASDKFLLYFKFLRASVMILWDGTWWTDGWMDITIARYVH